MKKIKRIINCDIPTFEDVMEAIQPHKDFRLSFQDLIDIGGWGKLQERVNTKTLPESECTYCTEADKTCGACIDEGYESAKDETESLDDNF